MIRIEGIAAAAVCVVIALVVSACGSTSSAPSINRPGSTTSVPASTTLPITPATKADANAMVGSFNTVADDINGIQSTNDYVGLNGDCKSLADSVNKLLADPVPSAVAAEATTYKTTLAEIEATGQACESVSNYPELAGAAILLPKAAGTMKTFVAMIG